MKTSKTLLKISFLPLDFSCESDFVSLFRYDLERFRDTKPRKSMDKIHNVKECQELAHTTDMDSETRKTLRETYPKSQDFWSEKSAF